MYRKIARAAAGAAIMAASLGGGQAAQAATVSVPCSSPALTAAMTSAARGDTLSLAAGCVYRQAILPAVSHDLTVMGNGATLKDSGDLTVNLAATLTITSLDFRKTRIVIRDGASVTIRGGSFARDTGVNGGAIDDNSGGLLTVTGVTFTGNTASGDGGAIFDEGNLGAVITDCAFYRNHATAGGAVYGGSQSGDDIINSVITGNTATTAGGGIASAAYLGVAITGGRITGNHAATGGGMYTTVGPARITSTVIARNTASGDGGGIYYDQNPTEDPAPAYLDGVTITRNTAAGHGGGILDVQWQVTVTGTRITRNTAGSGGGGLYTEQAGAIFTLTATSAVTGNVPDNCEPTDMGACTGVRATRLLR